MRKLSRKVFQKIEDQLMSYGRELEKARFQYLFGHGSSQAVVDALKQYQNEDGGFGHGLESDFLMPLSSPMATTVGFQIFDEIQGEDAASLIQAGIRYYESTFNPSRNGWFALTAEVNDYPHALWWDYMPEQQMTVIDYSWGNPSAEIIGNLLKYRAYVSQLDVEALVQHACTYLLHKEQFNSEHEMYCFLRLYKHLAPAEQASLEAQLTTAVQSLVKLNPGEWQKYTPQPVHFVQKPGQATFGLTAEAFATNLDYLIDLLQSHGAMIPNWEWGQYPEAWLVARAHWMGELTVRTLKILQNFDRIEW